MTEPRALSPSAISAECSWSICESGTVSGAVGDSGETEKVTQSDSVNRAAQDQRCAMELLGLKKCPQ